MPLVGQHQVGAITTPVENDPLDPAIVVGHFQSLREKINDHDIDPDTHHQSGTTAARAALPAHVFDPGGPGGP